MQRRMLKNSPPVARQHRMKAASVRNKRQNTKTPCSPPSDPRCRFEQAQFPEEIKFSTCFSRPFLNPPGKTWASVDITAWIKIGYEWAKHMQTHKHTDRASHTATQTPTRRHTHTHEQGSTRTQICTCKNQPTCSKTQNARRHPPTRERTFTHLNTHTPSIVYIKFHINPNIRSMCVSWWRSFEETYSSMQGGTINTDVSQEGNC